MKWSSHHFIVFLRVFNEIEIITPPAISSLGCSNVEFMYVIANDVIGDEISLKTYSKTMEWVMLHFIENP